MVQVKLNRAEERQLTDAAVKRRSDQLKDAYYMMDDVLDTWNTAMIKSQIQKEEEKFAHSNAPALEKKKKKKVTLLPLRKKEEKSMVLLPLSMLF